MDSLDEINQVIVDPERGLVMNVDALATPEDKPKPRKPKKRAAKVTLKSNLSQSLITGYFNKSLSKIQSSSSAAYAPHVASSASSVPANEERESQDPEL